MAYCSNCGKQLGNQNSNFCDNCGNRASVPNIVINNQLPQQNSNDTGSGGYWFLGIVLGILFPIGGLITWLTMKGSKPKNAHAVGVGTWIGFGIFIVLSIILLYE